MSKSSLILNIFSDIFAFKLTTGRADREWVESKEGQLKQRWSYHYWWDEKLQKFESSDVSIEAGHVVRGKLLFNSLKKLKLYSGRAMPCCIFWRMVIQCIQKEMCWRNMMIVVKRTPTAMTGAFSGAAEGEKTSWWVSRNVHRQFNKVPLRFIEWLRTSFHLKNKQICWQEEQGYKTFPSAGLAFTF